MESVFLKISKRFKSIESVEYVNIQFHRKL